ncbi:MAG: hypothetical protein IJF09_01760, partial [Ruminiclostridium sp.]|nr:hypothetical protein [Ruminiclostridium sp.]
MPPLPLPPFKTLILIKSGVTADIGISVNQKIFKNPSIARRAMDTTISEATSFVRQDKYHLS